MALLTTVHNPFDPIGSREIKEIGVGKPIYSVIDGFYCHFDVVVSLNGMITHDYEYVIKEDDHIGFVAVPNGGGGKNPLATVAMIALAIAAPYAAGYIATGLTTNAAAMVAASSLYGSAFAIGMTAQMGIMIAGGMLINSLLPPSTPSQPKSNMMESSPTYGWDSAGNQSREGAVLPIIYGKTKITPPIISQYVETNGNKQYLNVLYALNDGEIVSVSNIMINDNPSSYYSDIQIETRLGTNSQTLIPSFDNTRVDNQVGAKLTTTETIRRTQYNNVKGITVTVSAPSGLYYANDKGGLDSRSVTLVVKVRKVGNTDWITLDNTSISGASTSTLRATYTIGGTFTSGGVVYDFEEGEYDISVRRTSAESTKTREQNKVYWESFTEIIYDDFTYPNTALLAIRALATDQLSGSMPRVSCVVDRGFGTSNPSVATQNLLTLLGAEYNQPAFDTWASYCDAENFQCNMVFDSETTARDALNIVGLLGRANIVQIGSEFFPIIERQESLPVQRFLFTMGNIIQDSFSESYLPLADRSNVVEVTYFDETLDYERQSVELYQKGFDESSDTVQKASLMLYGCTDRTQALRHARVMLNKNQYLTNTVSFEVDVDAIACTIGDVIDVAHDVPQWGYSGRVIDHDVVWSYPTAYVNGVLATSSNSIVIELDRDIEMISGVDYGIAFRLHDDTRVSSTLKVGTNVITNRVAVPNTFDIGQYDLYSFGQTERMYKQFRVLSITRSSDQRRKISAIEYVPTVYNDTGDEVVIPYISDLQTTTYLYCTGDVEVATDGRSINVVNVMWNGTGVSYKVYVKEHLSDSDWMLLAETTSTFYQMRGVKAGYYSFKVGDKETSLTVSIEQAPLADVANFISYYQNNQLVLRWDEVVEQYRSPIQYEIRRGVSWMNSEVLGKTLSNSYVIDSAGDYWVKAYYKDLNGTETYSINETGVSISSANIVRNVVATWDEYATGWSGTKTNLTVDGANLVYINMSEQVFDDDIFESDVYIGGGATNGTYEIPTSHIITLSTAQLCKVSLTYSASGGGGGVYIDDIPDFDSWSDIDGDVTGAWTVKPKIAISQDGTTWGDWQDYIIGDYVGKAFKAMLEVSTAVSGFSVLLDGFSFTIDMPDRVEKRDGVSISSSGTTVTHSYPFQAKPSTVITIVNAVSGDEVFLTAEDENGFTVQIKNGGVGVARTINSISQGY